MTAYTVTRSESYAGRLIELIENSTPEHTRTWTDYHGREHVDVIPAWTSRAVRIDGRISRRPAGTDDQVMAKTRAWIDKDNADQAMVSQLDKLTRVDPQTVPRPSADSRPGDWAKVYAMGRERVGVVVKLGRSRATVAFTTPSSGGRVYRKAVPAADPA